MTDKSPKITNKYEIITKQRISTEYFLSIWDGLEEYEHYSELLDTLTKIRSDDRVTLRVSSPGGRCDIGFTLIDRIINVPCRVDIEVPYPTYSMCAIMALCGDSLTIKPGAFLMFHDYSGGSYGKGNEMMKHIDSYSETFAYRLKQICQPFLTKKECDNILSGQDLYLKWNDKSLKERLKRHFK